MGKDEAFVVQGRVCGGGVPLLAHIPLVTLGLGIDDQVVVFHFVVVFEIDFQVFPSRAVFVIVADQQAVVVKEHDLFFVRGEVGEDPLHLVFKAETETQNAQRTVVFFDSLGIDQGCRLGGENIGFAVKLHILAAVEGLFDQGIETFFDRVGLVHVGLDVTGRIEDDDLVVDAVLFGVLHQVVAHGLFVDLAVFEEIDDHLVRSQKTDIRRPFEKVADEDIDGDLCLGLELVFELAQVFMQKDLDQVVFNRIKPFAGLFGHLEKRRGDVQGIDLSGQNHFMKKFALAQ